MPVQSASACHSHARVLHESKSRSTDLDAKVKLGDSPHNLKSEARALVKAEVRRRMAGSALEAFPRLRSAANRDPELAKETARLIFEVVEKLTTDDSSTLKLSPAAIPGAPLDTRVILDPKTKLNLVSVPMELYQGRADKSEKAETFLKRVWGKLTRHHLLYAEHLRRHDPHLYFALNYRAMTHETPLSEYLFAHGVMARPQISHPPKGFERQANVLRNVRTHLRAQTLNRTASEIVTPDQEL